MYVPGAGSATGVLGDSIAESSILFISSDIFSFPTVFINLSKNSYAMSASISFNISSISFNNSSFVISKSWASFKTSIAFSGSLFPT